jgi:predicted DNA-binding ribbon-helix-helix protein
LLLVATRRAFSVEDAFWNALKEIAGGAGYDFVRLVAIIDADRQSNLSSAIRLFVLGFYRDQISDHQGRSWEQIIS